MNGGDRRGFSNLRALGATALAIVLYVLLAVAASETFISGSPVRWWVATVVAVYLGGSAALWWFRNPLWNRIEWETKATISFFVLLGLLAFTVWLPGGLTQGLELFSLSTSTLLSLITAAAIAFSGVILFQLKYPHPVIKWTIAVLTAYGGIAFLWAIYAGSSYPALFHGESFWSWLPRWLQGGFIGALIIVPAALIYEIANILQQRGTIEFETWGLQQVIALGLSLLMVSSGITSPAGFRGSQPSAAQITEPLQRSYQQLGAMMAGSKPGTQTSPEEIADGLEKLFQALEEAERQIPRDTFDPQAIIDKVGRDPEKLFKWVRDNTYLVPYRGVLRGETGVLMDRLGNSLDRAMLLYSLLRSAGHTVQLAHGTLTEKQAKEVLQKAWPIPKDDIPPLKGSGDIPDDLLQKVTAQNQIDPAQLRKLITNTTAEQERMKEAVMQRVSEQASFIAAAVGKPKEDIRKKEEAAAIEALQDHWWVQLQQGSGWSDLDPTLLDAEPGRILTKAQETNTPDKLPATLYHEVAIRLLIEQWEQEKLEELPVLAHTLRPSEMFGKHLALRHVPMRWPKDFDLFQEKDPLQRLKTTVLAQNEWLPVLSVDDNMIAQSSFTDSGEVIQTPLALILGGAAQKSGKKIGDILDRGEIGEAPARKPKKEAQLTAEWIEYEIRVPGQAPRKIRREIFDLVGPAARSEGKLTTLEITEAHRLERGLTLMGETEILPLVSQLSPEFVGHLMAKNLLDNRETLLGILRQGKIADPKALDEQLGRFKPLPSQLYNLALARRKWSRFRGNVYLDHSNVLTYHRHLRLNAKGALLLREGFDIVANDVAVLPGSNIAPFLVRLEQGVVDTNAEAILAMAGCQLLERMSACTQVENTSEMFAKPFRESMGWLTVRTVPELASPEMELPKDMQVRIEQDLAAGYAVVVPKRAIHVGEHTVAGWWRVDPKSGQVLGIGKNGGQTTVERIIITAGVVVASLGICVLGLLGWSDTECRRDYFDDGRMRGGYRDLNDCIARRWRMHWEERKVVCIMYSVFGGAMVAGSLTGWTVFVFLAGAVAVTATNETP